MQKRNIGLVWFLATALLAASLQLAAGPAAGFPLGVSNSYCGTSRINYWITNTHADVSPQEYQGMQLGMEQWNLQNFEGQNGTNVNTPGVTAKVKFMALPTNTFGRSEVGACTDPDKYVIIDPTQNSGANRFGDVGAHELGHILGFGHAEDDNGSGGVHGYPLMSTCHSKWFTARNLEPTDMAQANHRADGYGPMVANPGFEEGSFVGYTVAGQQQPFVTVHAPKNGSYKAVIPSSTNGSTSLTQSLTTFDDQFGNTRTWGGSFWFRTPGNNGLAQMTAYHRPAFLPSGNSGCAYELANWRLDRPPTSYLWNAKGSAGYSTNSWSWKYGSIPQFSTSNNAPVDHIRMKVEFFGSSGHVEIDTPQLREY